LAVGRLAARTFRFLGLRHLFYFGDNSYYSTLRRKGFIADAGHHGCKVACAQEGRHPSEVDLRALVARAQGGPVGCFCCNDDTACALVQCIEKARLRAPQNLCVLGVGDEDIVQLRSPLPFSSIELPAYGIGAAAVEMLLAWRVRPGRPPADRLLPPLRVVHRQTTGAFGIEDPLARSALEIIEHKSGRNLSVADIVRDAGRTSRRTLEVRFRRATGRSLHAAILAARLARAKELLAAPALSIKEIASLTGFSSPQKFSTVFRRIEGCPPAEFRRRAGAERRKG
jgi:LacI family transcriptional regulator